MIWSVILLIIALGCIWFSASVVVETVSTLSKRLKVSDFWVSFFVLGLSMSAPEIAVGINTIIFDLPEVLIGDKLGSSVGIFLFVIPMLAVMAGGVSLKNKVSDKKLKLAFGMILLPFLLIIDGNFLKVDSLVCLVVYVFLMIYLAITAKRESYIKSAKDDILVKRSNFGLEIVELILASLVIYLSGGALVESFRRIVEDMGGSFLNLSMILMSLGTSMPEILVVFKSAMSGKKEMAFGGYLGSAVANSLILAILALFYGDIIIGKQLYFRLLFGLFAAGLVIFYQLTKSKDELSRKEGFVLVVLYVLVVLITAYF